MKKIIIALISFTIFAFFSSPVSAFKRETFTSLVYPIRLLGDDQINRTLDLPISVYQESTPSATPITWLLTPDVVNSQDALTIRNLLAHDLTQDIGLLIEITPDLQQRANVEPPAHSSQAYLLTSYTQRDRARLIDTLIADFFNAFGTYPKSVGATYLDAYSLDYLASKYSVLAASLGIPGPDGQRLSTKGVQPYFPYFPSKLNTLTPAQSADQKIPVAITFWNPPDLAGNPTFSPEKQLTWSLFTQDNQLFDLLTQFDRKDLNEFAYLNWGLDNRQPFDAAITSALYTFNTLAKENKRFTLHPVTLADFGMWLNQRYPFNSPAQEYHYTLGDTSYLYYSNPFYQFAAQTTEGNTLITQLTTFHPRQSEIFYNHPNLTDHLTLTTFPHISSDNPLPFNLDLTTAEYDFEYWDLIIDQGDNHLRLNPNDITTNVDNNFAEHPAITRHGDVYRIDPNWAPFSSSRLDTVLQLTKVVALIITIFLILKRFTNFKPPRPPFWTTLLLLGGTLLWSLTTIRSGTLTPFGLSYWGAHDHDAFFHLSLIESFKNSLWPLNNPNLVGSLVINYHIVYDYLLAILSKFLLVPASFLYFQIIPPVMALSIGYLSYLLLKAWGYQKTAINVALILLYTAGSLGFIQSLLNSGNLFGGESTFWMQQNITTLINPPYALSLVMLLGFLNLYHRWHSSLNPKRIITLSLLAALLIQTKAYSSILLLGALVLSMFNTKKNFSYWPHLKLLGLTLILSVLLTLPTLSGGSSPFEFYPLWFIQNMFSSPDRFYISKVADAWQAYLINGNYFKLAFLQLGGLFVFLVGNLGIRLLATKQVLKNLSSHPSHKLVSLITILGLLTPLVVIQSGNSWNAIQFSYYSLFFMSLLTAPVIVDLLDRSHILPKFLLLLSLFAFLTFPTTIGSLQTYLSPRPSVAIDYQELHTLEYLKNQPDGLVITPTYKENDPWHTSPFPAFSTNTNAYVPALTGKPVYLADEINLDIMGYDYGIQKKLNHLVYFTDKPDIIQGVLSSNNITYLYENPIKHLIVPSSELSLTKIFDTSYYDLYSR